MDHSPPNPGNILVIADHHSRYIGNAESIIGNRSNICRTLKSREYVSASGPYSDLLQTQDYVIYAASTHIEYVDPTYSDRMRMSFKRFLRMDK